MPSKATQHLIATLLDKKSKVEAAQSAADGLLSEIVQASKSEANNSLRSLVDHIQMENMHRGAFVALVCGAMIEHGCDPHLLSQPLTRQLQQLLELSARLAKACVAKMPKPKDDDDDPADAFAEARQAQIEKMPVENRAWEALETLWRPAIALYSLLPTARANASSLLPLAAKIADYHEGGHWLRLMLSVLDNEPILVIEPDTRLGILANISGIVDNFQLNVLLMDGFPRTSVSRRRVSKQVADVARGVGPQQTDDTVTGAWNLYSWKAIKADLDLPVPDDVESRIHWIWNEGSPNDIPSLDGRRVILLGPATYSRSWNCNRMFDRLAASLQIERKLSPKEVTEQLRRMSTAK
jgi:hypothetical protein